MPFVNHEELLSLAVDAAQEAGDVLRSYFRTGLRASDTKSSTTDPVSEADRDAERRLVEFLRARRPGDAFIGEEGGERGGDSGVRWILDPLDGTVNFLYGIAQWGVSVAAEDDEGMLVGVVHDALHDETFAARRGGGAHLNGEPIRVSSQDDLAQALVGTGFSYDARARAQQAGIIQRVLPSVRDVRRAGSVALDLAHLACGRLDAFYEAPMEIWDRAAGVVILQEAGATVSDLPAPLGLSTGVIAANPRLHEQLRALVLG